MFLLIVYILLALVVSFLCSILEAVALSVTDSWVKGQERKGARSAPRWRRFKDDIEQPLAAILSLNTIAHTAGASGAGAQALVVFEDAGVAMISVILTLLILVFSEIIPKTLGARYWKRLAGPLALPMQWLIWSMYPLVAMSRVIGRLLTRGEEGPRVTRDEFAAMAEMAAEDRVLGEQESKMIVALQRFRSLLASDVMTPRTVVEMVAAEASVDEIYEWIGEQRFSRFPVFAEGDRDHIVGYVLKSDVLLAQAEGNGAKTIGQVMREVPAVPHSLSLQQLLQQMLEERAHLVLLVDEYGGVAGIVTMEDVVETLLGTEIVDEVDSVEDMRAYARTRWRERAARLGIPIDDEEL